MSQRFAPSTIATMLSISAAALLLSPPAFAGEERSVPVRYGDLDLTSDADVAKLDKRIRSAARRVCDDHGTRDIERMMLASQCRNDALTQARPKVEFAVAAARTGKDYADSSIKVRAAH